VHTNIAPAKGGSILVFQTISPIRKAVVASRYNPIAVITLSSMLKILKLIAGFKTFAAPITLLKGRAVLLNLRIPISSLKTIVFPTLKA